MYINNYNHKQYIKFFTYIFSITIVFFIILVSIYSVCFIDNNMLMKLFDRFNTPKNLPFTLSRDDLNLIQHNLMDYLSGKLNFLDTKVTINGTLTEFYSIRTKVHMGDVKNLFSILIKACYIDIIICLFAGFKVANNFDNISYFKETYKKTVLVFIIIFFIIISFAVINFDTFFVKFHELLFDNDYWLLDPNEDYIICLLPEEIFQTIGIRIAITIIIFLFLVGFVLQILSKIQLHQEAK